MIHDPHHVAQLAAMLLSSHGSPEPHHIKKAVESARTVLDEAFLRASEDEASAKAEADKPAEEATGEAVKPDGGSQS